MTRRRYKSLRLKSFSQHFVFYILNAFPFICICELHSYYESQEQSGHSRRLSKLRRRITVCKLSFISHVYSNHVLAQSSTPEAFTVYPLIAPTPAHPPLRKRKVGGAQGGDALLHSRCFVRKSVYRLRYVEVRMNYLFICLPGFFF